MADEKTVLPPIPAAGGRHYTDAPGFRRYNEVWFVVALAKRVPPGEVVRIWQRTNDVWRQVRIVRHVAEYKNRQGRRFVLCEFENAHDTEYEWRRDGGVPE